MNKNCLKCGKEYTLHAFSFDSGYCDGCKPGFFSLPERRESTPAETRKLFKAMTGLNGFLTILFSMILDCGEISNPGMFFFGSMTAFWLIEYIICEDKARGFPKLTLLQQWIIILSPFYGFPAFTIIWLFLRAVIFKECR